MARFTLYVSIVACLTTAIGNKITDDFYVSSSRKDCEQVESQRPCPATLLSPDKAIDYEFDVEMVAYMLNETRVNNASDECISDLTTVYCSKITPRCFVNGSSDYGDARAACWRANRTCPTDSLEEGFCESLKTGIQPLSACVKPSQPINGSCPQPKHKMPADKLDLYIKSSLEYEEISYFTNLTTVRYPNGTRMFSPSCVSKIKELYCLPFYCSTDEEKIVVEYTYEDCEKTFSECFDNAIENLPDDKKDEILDLKDRYYDNCDFYPDDPSSHGSGETPTVPGKNVSSTPLRRNATTTPSTQGIPSTTSGQNVSSTLSKENVTSTPPKQNMSSTYPRHDATSRPPRQNISSTHPGKTESTQPTEEVLVTDEAYEKSKTSTPSIFAEIMPTAGTGRSQNFPPLLLLLFLFVLV